MNILMVHNRYRFRGGEDVSTEAETAMLREHGHNVEPFSRDNRDIPELGGLEWGSVGPALRLGAETVWSRSVHREVKALLRQRSFDIVHVQNSFPQISPSVLYAARSAGVAVVQSLRNYRLVCANGTFYRDDAVCELCMGRAVGAPAVRYECYQDDRVATGAVVALQSIHRLAGSWDRSVSVYIALSRFAAGKHIEGGVPADRVVVKPNFLADDPGPGSGDRSGFVYVGRLSEEKGIDTLLEAWESIPAPLTIIGDGPLAHLVEQATARNPRIDYRGARSNTEAVEVLGSAQAAVVPSRWHEPFGRGVIEAYSRATPVIAARMGALPELVDDGRTGILFEPGDADDLVRAAERVLADPDPSIMSQAARLEFEAKYTADENYPQLMGIYDQALRTRPA
ncbi:MAG: glycosyltransferase [Acidimicrobiia bacterium]|nr:glycosyltransferase [Acidimicrobiia bacterium]